MKQGANGKHPMSPKEMAKHRKQMMGGKGMVKVEGKIKGKIIKSGKKSRYA